MKLRFAVLAAALLTGASSLFAGVVATPEPASIGMIAGGAIALGAVALIKARRKK